MIDVTSKKQLEEMQKGKVVRLLGEVGVYAGLECVTYPRNISYMQEDERTGYAPIVIYPCGEGRIKKEIVYSMDNDETRSSGSSSCDFIMANDAEFDVYQSLLKNHFPDLLLENALKDIPNWNELAK
jgi:hypothetical protein